MKGVIAALTAVVAAGASAAGIAAWAKRRQQDDGSAEVGAVPAEAERAGSSAVAVESDGNGDGAGETGTATAGDDLTTIKGIGAISQDRLAAAGVTTFAQVAAWTDEDIEGVGARIKVSPARIHREDWVGQARAAGGS